MKLGKAFHHGDTANTAEKSLGCAKSQRDMRTTANNLHLRRAAVFAVVNALSCRVASADFYVSEAA